MDERQAGPGVECAEAVEDRPAALGERDLAFSLLDLRGEGGARVILFRLDGGAALDGIEDREQSLRAESRKALRERRGSFLGADRESRHGERWPVIELRVDAHDRDAGRRRPRLDRALDRSGPAPLREDGRMHVEEPEARDLEKRRRKDPAVGDDDTGVRSDLAHLLEERIVADAQRLHEREVELAGADGDGRGLQSHAAARGLVRLRDDESHFVCARDGVERGNREGRRAEEDDPHDGRAVYRARGPEMRRRGTCRAGAGVPHYNRRMVIVRCILLVAGLVIALSLDAQVAEGDRHYANRAAGARGAQAQAGPIDAALAAYQRAIAAAPGDLEAHWKLLRAYRFKGSFVARTAEERKSVYGEAKKAGERALAVAAARIAERGVDAARAKEKDVAAAARAIPGVAETWLWDAVNWGEWALAYGKLAAVRQGAADHIRRGATIAHLANPGIEDAAPSRVLGRLHDQTPRVPFLTGWASSKEAIRFLEESLRLAPGNKLTMLFLSEALLSHDSGSRTRALQLLQTIVRTPDAPAFAVEDAAATADAKAMLAKWTGGS